MTNDDKMRGGITRFQRYLFLAFNIPFLSSLIKHSLEICYVLSKERIMTLRGAVMLIPGFQKAFINGEEPKMICCFVAK